MTRKKSEIPCIGADLGRYDQRMNGWQAATLVALALALLAAWIASGATNACRGR